MYNCANVSRKKNYCNRGLCDLHSLKQQECTVVQICWYFAWKHQNRLWQRGRCWPSSSSSSEFGPDRDGVSCVLCCWQRTSSHEERSSRCAEMRRVVTACSAGKEPPTSRGDMRVWILAVTALLTAHNSWGSPLHVDPEVHPSEQLYGFFIRNKHQCLGYMLFWQLWGFNLYQFRSQFTALLLKMEIVYVKLNKQE